MCKFIFLLVSLVSLLPTVKAQDSLTKVSSQPSYPKIKYKSTVVCLPYRKVRDLGQSPLFHNGPSVQIAKYNERWRSKSITKYEMVIGIGLLKTNKKKISAVTSVYLLNMEINYHYLKPAGSILKGKGNLYLGGIFTNTFDGRLYPFLGNNSFGYEFSNVLNPAAAIAYDFNYGKNERKYQVGFKLNFALLAHVIRTNYIGMEPAQAYSNEKINPYALFTHGNKIALPNRFFRINTEIYLDRFKKINNDKFRIFYGWGMHVTRLPQSNPLYYVNHTVGFVSMLYSEKQKKVRRNKVRP